MLMGNSPLALKCMGHVRVFTWAVVCESFSEALGWMCVVGGFIFWLFVLYPSTTLACIVIFSTKLSGDISLKLWYLLSTNLCEGVRW